MTSLMGECFGVVKNSVNNSADDSNCYWKSGDQNYKLAVLRNSMQVWDLKSLTLTLALTG